MKTVLISEFKAKCLALLERVRKTHRPIRITRFGKPVAEVVPSSPTASTVKWIGSMKGEIKILGDIVAPVMHDDDWEAWRG